MKQIVKESVSIYNELSLIILTICWLKQNALTKSNEKHR
jgi:hypothetical protein